MTAIATAAIPRTGLSEEEAGEAGCWTTEIVEAEETDFEGEAGSGFF